MSTAMNDPQQPYSIIAPGAPQPEPLFATPAVADALAAGERGASLDIGGIVEAFRRWWWLVVVATVAGGALAALYLMRTEPVFVSHATVEVAQGRLRVLNVEELKPEDLGDLEVLKTIEQNFASSSLMLRVADACGLRSDPDFRPPGGGDYTDAQMAGILGAMVGVDLRRGTRLIDITVEDSDAGRAARIAAAVVTEYQRWEVEDGRGLAASAQGTLAGEAERLRVQLEGSEKKLQDLREAEGAVALIGREGLLEEKAKALNAELAKAKSERAALEAAIGQAGGAGAALSLPEVSSRPEIVALRGKLSGKEGEFAVIKKRYGPKWPAYIQAEGELEELRAALDREVELAVVGLRGQSESLAGREAKLEEELAAVRADQLELARALVPYRALEREVEAERSLYAGVLKRGKEAAATAALESASVSLKDAPLPASDPVWPRKKLVLGLGLFAGLALGACGVFALGLFDQKFRSQAGAERVLGMPLLAALPSDATGFEPRGAAGEAYRSLRAALGFVGKGGHARTFLFASALEGEGAAACAANTAAGFARQGQRTLLIDGDLRDPELDLLLLGKRAEAGLGQYLGGGDAGQVVAETAVENLYLLPAGKVDRAAGELLCGPRLAGLVDESRGWFHRVVISAPALCVVSDGLLLARLAESVCLVVEAGRSTRGEVRRACSLLAMAGVPPVGFVLRGGRGRKVSVRRSRARVPVDEGESVLQGA